MATLAAAARPGDVPPGPDARPGLTQLAAVCEAYFSYVERRVFPGGCFFAVTALEKGFPSGPVVR